MTKQKKAGTKSVAPGSKAGKQPVGAGAGPKTKLARLEGMLRRLEGATIAQLVKTLNWQVHSVRGAMSGALKKKQGLKITATKLDSGERVYRVAG